MYPCPDTPQYTKQCARCVPRLEFPSTAIQCQGWVRTNLNNIIDSQSQTFADRYLVGQGSQNWYYARIDGWVLHFWDTDATGAEVDRITAHSVGLLDLRTVVHVEACKSRGGFHEVIIGMSNGSFSFGVQEAKAVQMWTQHIQQAIVENIHLQRVHREAGRERAHSTKSRIVIPSIKGQNRTELMLGADQLKHYSVSPDRAGTLRRLWVDCLRTAEQGAQPETFAALFALYNFDGDDNLDLDEVEIMLQELLVMRQQELRNALESQRQKVVTEERIILDGSLALQQWQKAVGDPGQKLQKQYNSMLQGGGLESRAILLRSELDTSRDGRVSLCEFLQGAPQFLLPRRELLLEAQFYKSCAAAFAQITANEDRYEEEGGCLHQ